jgi:superoxide dismutase, Cu-Zn family
MATRFVFSALCVAVALGIGSTNRLLLAQTAAHHHEHAAHAPAATIDRAVAVMVPVGQSGVSGVVHFAKQAGGVEVTGKITGLTPGKHAFHVHEFGDLTDAKEAKSAGSHFNPAHAKHGDRTSAERHAGDFGNIEANSDGVAEFSFVDPVVQLTGPQGIIGRSLVVHAGVDKFTQPVGDAGGRVTFGVVGVAQPPK